MKSYEQKSSGNNDLKAIVNILKNEYNEIKKWMNYLQTYQTNFEKGFIKLNDKIKQLIHGNAKKIGELEKKQTLEIINEKTFGKNVGEEDQKNMENKSKLENENIKLEGLIKERINKGQTKKYSYLEKIEVDEFAKTETQQKVDKLTNESTNSEKKELFRVFISCIDVLIKNFDIIEEIDEKKSFNLV